MNIFKAHVRELQAADAELLKSSNKEGITRLASTRAGGCLLARTIFFSIADGAADALAATKRISTGARK